MSKILTYIKNTYTNKYFTLRLAVLFFI